MNGFPVHCDPLGSFPALPEGFAAQSPFEETREDDTPFRARVSIKHAGKQLEIGIVPDRLFAFAFENGTRSDFALEQNRGTMVIEATRLIGKSSYRKKLIAYYQLWKDDPHSKRWGF